MKVTGVNEFSDVYFSFLRITCFKCGDIEQIRDSVISVRFRTPDDPSDPVLLVRIEVSNRSFLSAHGRRCDYPLKVYGENDKARFAFPYLSGCFLRIRPNDNIELDFLSHSDRSGSHFAIVAKEHSHG